MRLTISPPSLHRSPPGFSPCVLNKRASHRYLVLKEKINVYFAQITFLPNIFPFYHSSFIICLHPSDVYAAHRHPWTFIQVLKTNDYHYPSIQGESVSHIYIASDIAGKSLVSYPLRRIILLRAAYQFHSRLATEHRSNRSKIYKRQRISQRRQSQLNQRCQ